MRNLYLTQHGQSWVFQRRLPKALDPDFSLAAIRIRLGPLPLKQARRLAALLGAASQLIFERLIKENTMAEPETKLAITEGELQKVVPFFRGLELAPWSITVTGPPIKEPSGSRLVH